MDGGLERLRTALLLLVPGGWCTKPRRILHDKPEHGYTAARPWNAAFAAAVRDGDFWTRELVTPATLWLSQRQPGSSSGGGSGTDRRRQGSGGEEGEPPRKKPKGGKKRYEGEDMSEKKGTIFVRNRCGAIVCEGYNKGKCGSKKPESKCKDKNSHQCNVCLGPHPAYECQAYGRGSATKALECLNDPAHCADSRATTALGPVESRLKQWEAMSHKAGLEPFRLTPHGYHNGEV